MASFESDRDHGGSENTDDKSDNDSDSVDDDDEFEDDSDSDSVDDDEFEDVNDSVDVDNANSGNAGDVAQQSFVARLFSIVLWAVVGVTVVCMLTLR